MLAGCNRDGRFIAPKDDRDESSSVCVNIDRDEVLFVRKLASVGVL